MFKWLFVSYIIILAPLPHTALADIKTKYACPWNVHQQEQGFAIQYTGTKDVNELNFYAFLQDPEKPLTYENLQESVRLNAELVSITQNLFRLPQENLAVYLIVSDIELEGLKKNKLSLSQANHQETNVSLEPITNIKAPGDDTLILRPVEKDNDTTTDKKSQIASNQNNNLGESTYMKVCKMMTSLSGD